MKYFKKTTTKPLGELLLERGVISREQIDNAIEYQKKHGGLIGEILVELKYATEKDIAQALTCQYGFPYLPLASYEIDAELTSTVPKEVCLKYCLIPIDKIGRSLTIAMANPLNFQAAQDVEALTECMVQVFVATTSDIKQCIEKYYQS
ncbi:MAG: hypothetical protein K8S27_13255 [Candidatus Omnitrophica bacterium]|nr:hypothetical protein [Candidatus Omnitrophota bacterium]